MMSDTAHYARMAKAIAYIQDSSQFSGATIT